MARVMAEVGARTSREHRNIRRPNGERARARARAPRRPAPLPEPEPDPPADPAVLTGNGGGACETGGTGPGEPPARTEACDPPGPAPEGNRSNARGEPGGQIDPRVRASGSIRPTERPGGPSRTLPGDPTKVPPVGGAESQELRRCRKADVCTY